jgi:hypothetical protein
MILGLVKEAVLPCRGVQDWSLHSYIGYSNSVAVCYLFAFRSSVASACDHVNHLFPYEEGKLLTS